MIEMLTCVVIVGILASISVPNYITQRNKSKVASVKANMHCCQIAVESYATEQAGAYPATAVEFAPYYPGGGMTAGGTAGNYPNNPYTNLPDAPTVGGIADVITARTQPAGSITGTAGNVQYTYIDAAGGGQYSYGIVGFDEAGKSVSGATGQLVLSNL